MMEVYLIGDANDRGLRVSRLQSRGFEVINPNIKRDPPDVDEESRYKEAVAIIDKLLCVHVVNKQTELSKRLIKYARDQGKRFVRVRLD